MQVFPTSVEAVLFDWDGTLADTLALVTAATNEVPGKAGFGELDETAVHDGMRFATSQPAEPVDTVLARTGSASAIEPGGGQSFHG